VAARGGAYYAFAGAARRRRVSRFHTPVVKVAKIGLPIAAASLLASVFAWPEDGGLSSPGLGEGVSAQVKMDGIEAYGWDDNRPYSVRSDGIRRLGAEGQRFFMDRPQARLTLAGGAWLAGRSDRGVLDWTERTMQLSGAVRLDHEKEYAIRTEAAFVHLADKTVAGDRPVEGVGNSGWFRGEGFRILDGGMRIRLLGRSSVSFSFAPEAPWP